MDKGGESLRLAQHVRYEIRLDADKYFWGSQMLALISSVDSHKSKTKKIIKSLQGYVFFEGRRYGGKHQNLANRG